MTDFDLDGAADLVIGAPLTSVDGVHQAGAVTVLYGDAPVGEGGWTPRESQVIDQGMMNDAPEVADRLGLAVATGRFNEDDYSDLAIGVPYEDLESSRSIDSGVVHVLYGSAVGLVPSSAQFLQLGDDRQAGSNLFGWSLLGADVGGSGASDLVIGAPSARAASSRSGIIAVATGSPSGLDEQFEVLHQQQQDVGPPPRGEDRFGYAITSVRVQDLPRAAVAVGAPFRSARGHLGTVTLIRDPLRETGSARAVVIAPPRSTRRQVERFGWSVASGAFSGDRDTELVIGAPGRRPGGRAFVYGIDSRGRAVRRGQWSMSNDGRGTDPGRFDNYGATLVAADANDDRYTDLVIAAPGDRVGAVERAGSVTILEGASTGLTAAGSTRLTQRVLEPSTRVTRDSFLGQGLGVIAQDGTPCSNGVVVGVPFADRGGRTDAGVAYVWSDGRVVTILEDDSQEGFGASIAPAI